MELIDRDLSEPYSIFTYRYFVRQWPQLCFLALDGAKAVGVVVCKMDLHRDHMRGYLAMLVVDNEYRGKRIGELRQRRPTAAVQPHVPAPMGALLHRVRARDRPHRCTSPAGTCWAWLLARDLGRDGCGVPACCRACPQVPPWPAWPSPA
jgi:GNAT superfamily N-acetyltransferase